MLRHMKILIVDDIEENIQLLGTILRKEKYKISFAFRGSQALKMLDKNSFDLIILDVKMPEMDGFETCRLIKRKHEFKEVPVIFITAKTDKTSEIKGFAAGGVDYITRPFEAEKVIARVKAHLHIQYLQQQLQEEMDRYKALESAAFDGIAIHENGKLIEVSDTLAAMFGYAPEHLEGRNILEFIAPKDREHINEKLLEADEVRHVINGIKKGGTHFTMECRGKNTRFKGRSSRVIVIRDLSEEKRLEQENMALRAGMDDRDHLAGLVGNTPVMHRIYDSIINAAVSEEITIIYGETGTGKELAARTIYELSPRAQHRFLPVNCGAVQETLFETLFFGYRKGAFTGADHNCPGYFEQADCGTLFLDEIGELTIPMQAKLLRVLQDGEFTPLGSDTPLKADVRIIAATNRELRKFVKSGHMREDFFQRIHVIAIEMPPLRNHKEDIKLFAEYFLKQHGPDNFKYQSAPNELIERFMGYDWPGNVRELFNELRRWIAGGEVELGGAMYEVSDYDYDKSLLSGTLTFNEIMESFEKKLITQALEHYKGNRTHVSQTIKIPRKTLQRKITKYSIKS